MEHGSPGPRFWRCAVIFGEVGEALELVGVLITIFGSLAIMVVLGKFWEA